MPFPILAGKAIVDSGYNVDNSCRFNDNDEPTLSRDIGTVTLATKSTFSCWVKQGKEANVTIEEDAGNPIFGAFTDGNNRSHIAFNDTSPPHLEVWSKKGGSVIANLVTTASYRDLSAWMHVCVAVDTTQGTASNRIKVYVNGTRVTDFGTETYPDEDAVLEWSTNSASSKIGAKHGGSGPSAWMDGYLAEVYFIDGTAYAASDFGEFNEDSPTIWQPKDASGLTFGDEGFYCDFEDSGDLGDDESGNTNDLTENNIVAADQATDTPTNNFCTLNPLSRDEMTFAEGNCKATQASDDGGGSRTDDNARGTMGVSSGKFYWEVKGTGGSGAPVVVGICFDKLKMGSDLSGETGVYAIQNAGATNAYKRENGTTAETSGFTNPATNDIINVALDMDNGKLYIGINGTYENQAGSTGDPAGGSNETFSSIDTSYFWLPFVESRGDNQAAECNFGGCPSFSISSGNADANGYGNFEYAVPSGYYALCTKNLAEYG
jgi:hypothetical protein